MNPFRFVLVQKKDLMEEENVFPIMENMIFFAFEINNNYQHFWYYYFFFYLVLCVCQRYITTYIIFAWHLHYPIPSHHTQTWNLQNTLHGQNISVKILPKDLLWDMSNLVNKFVGSKKSLNEFYLLITLIFSYTPAIPVL